VLVVPLFCDHEDPRQLARDRPDGRGTRVLAVDSEQQGGLWGPLHIAVRGCSIHGRAADIAADVAASWDPSALDGAFLARSCTHRFRCGPSHYVTTFALSLASPFDNAKNSGCLRVRSCLRSTRGTLASQRFPCGTFLGSMSFKTCRSFTARIPGTGTFLKVSCRGDSLNRLLTSCKKKKKKKHQP